jgi:hypothetical protein
LCATQVGVVSATPADARAWSAFPGRFVHEQSLWESCEEVTERI